MIFSVLRRVFMLSKVDMEHLIIEHWINPKYALFFILMKFNIYSMKPPQICVAHINPHEGALTNDR